MKRSGVYSRPRGTTSVGDTSKQTTGAGKHGGNNSTALTAVALQDHYMKSLSLNFDVTQRVNVAGNRTKTKPKQVKPVVNTHNYHKPKVSSRKTPERKEYVLDPKPAPMTLAQKMGLVAVSGDQPLTEDDWQKVKAKSNEREDSKLPCVICKEDFDSREQVILSCSHVFHKNCIQAFEKFAGKKSCPMCRQERYQTRIIYEGSVQYQHKCATRIQALWRGYVVHSWYKKLRETVPPKDPLLKKKFYEQKLQSITDRMLQSVDSDVDGFLQDLDKSLAESRNVFKQLDNAVFVTTDEEWEEIQLKAVTRGCVDCPICLTNLESKGLVAQSKAASPRKPVPNGKRAKDKMSTMDKNTKDQDSSVHTSRTRLTVLLSCSHVFHQTCLEAFEGFAVDQRSNICPVCRAHYQKKVI